MGELLIRENELMVEEEEEAEAAVRVWKCVFGYVEMAVVKCAVELRIFDVIEKHGKPMTLDELSAVLACSSLFLHRIMRFLAHQKFLKERFAGDGVKSYDLTPLSRFFTRDGERSMKGLLLLESSPVMLAPWHYLSGRVRNGPAAFEAAHGEDVWEYASKHPEHSELISDAMACDARVSVPAIIDGCAGLFDGINTVVDVGGADGTALGLLVKAFPSIKGFNFDLPHVISVAPEINGVEHVCGDMFEAVPKAELALIKWVLHDWSDYECVQILSKCREAVLDADKGKVIIVEAVIREDDDSEFKHVGLMLDMIMMAHTNSGKERTQEEWGSILTKAGFSRFTVKPIHAVQSVIVAYP
ncbi:O-methyltransferase protein [Thalictrum thalictroides]|uniref:O-methyltransferase protein n=1 Tax=Thalictrum thalictroides TaxID=46969 RepID=A0A7J6X6D9_THATH|nr:O-methyltransferase protein [Thalictrum thalictroides]